MVEGIGELAFGFGLIDGGCCVEVEHSEKSKEDEET